jgi:putative MATE family efflux protein
MVLEMIMESVFAVVDIFWVSKLGADAVAAVGVTESLLTIVYAAAMGLAMGASAVVARRIGEGDRPAASRAAVQALHVAVGLAVVIGAIGAALGPSLLGALGAEASTIAIGGGYARVMLGGSVTVVLLFVVNAIFRGAGDAAIAMRTLWLANGINIVLGPFLVFGWGPFPRLGVTGAAIATTFGRGVGVVHQLWALRRPDARICVAREHLRIDRPVLATILRLSATGFVQGFIGTASWLALVRILSAFGSIALAGYTIAIRIVMFALLPSWGMSNAAATLVGQNLGAKQPDRAERAVWRAALYNVVFLGGVSLAFVLAAGAVVAPFATDPAVVAVATRALRIIAAGFVLYAFGMVVVQAFNGAGDTRTPTVLNLICFWLFELPVAWALAHAFGLGPGGVFLAITLAFSLVAIVGMAVFRRGGWKRQRV